MVDFHQKWAKAILTLVVFLLTAPAHADDSTYATIVNNSDGTQTYTFNHLDALKLAPPSAEFSCTYDNRGDTGIHDGFALTVSDGGPVGCAVSSTSLTGSVEPSVNDTFQFSFTVPGTTTPRTVTRVQFDTSYTAPPYNEQGSAQINLTDNKGNDSVATVLTGGTGGHVDYTVPAGLSAWKIFVGGGSPVVLSNIVLTVGSTSQSSISVVGMRAAQVVYNPTSQVYPNLGTSLDLVQGKSASFEVTLTGAGLAGISDTVNVQILANGSPLILTTNPIKASDVAAAGTAGLVITPDQFPSFIVGQSSAPVTYTAQIIKANSTSNIIFNSLATPLIANVYQTHAPNIAIIPLVSPSCGRGKSCFGSVLTSDLNSTAALKDYISDVFPFADLSVSTFIATSPSLVGSSLTGFSIPNPISGETSYSIGTGVVVDLINLAIMKYKGALGPNVNRITAIVPHEYFIYHKIPSTIGLTIPSIPIGSLVLPESGNFAHELSHTFGVTDDEDYQAGTNDAAQYVKEGYNARLMQLYNSITTDTATYPVPSVTGNGGVGGPTLYSDTDFWVNPNRYAEWFNAALRPEVDPEVSYIGGYINSDGSFTVVESGLASNGFSSPEVTGGDIRVQLVDDKGAILNSTTVSSSTAALSNQKTSSTRVSLSVIPVVASIAYVSGGTALEVVKDKKVLVHSIIQERTLSAIIAAIPNDAFKISPFLTRLVLSYEVREIQNAIEKKQCNRALAGLGLVMSELQIGLKNSYPIISGQLSKTEVLQDLQNIIKGLEQRI